MSDLFKIVLDTLIRWVWETFVYLVIGFLAALAIQLAWKWSLEHILGVRISYGEALGLYVGVSVLLRSGHPITYSVRTSREQIMRGKEVGDER